MLNDSLCVVERRRSDWQEDHSGHLRGLGCTRGRGVLGQRQHQGGQECSLRRQMGGQVSGQGRAVQPRPCTSKLIHSFITAVFETST